VANWSELKLALENEAKSVSGGTGELIRVESDPKSESALVISSKSKRMTLT
jgi:hypothetical protein